MSEIPQALENIQPAASLDVQGLNCPLPLLRIKKKLAKLAIGEVLLVVGAKPSSHPDIFGWCERVGHLYLGEKEESGHLSFFIKRCN